MIDLTTDDGIRDALRSIADWPAPDALGRPASTDGVVDGDAADQVVVALRSATDAPRADRPRAVRPWWAAVAAALVLVVGVLMVGPSSSTAVPAARGDWALMAPAPIEARSHPASVWTGEELIVWGGYDGEAGADAVERTDGAAYDPATDTWRTIADYPFDHRRFVEVDDGVVDIPEIPSAGVAGEAIFVVPSPAGTDAWDIAAYDPEADRWRLVFEARFDRRPTSALVSPTSGIPVHEIDAVVAHGDRLVVVGSRSDGSQSREFGWVTLDTANGEWGDFDAWEGSGEADTGDGMRAVLAADGRHLIAIHWFAAAGGLPDGYVVDLVTGRSAPIRMDGLPEAQVGETLLAADGTVLTSAQATTDAEPHVRWSARRIVVGAGSAGEAAAPSRRPVLTTPATQLVATDRGPILIGGLNGDSEEPAAMAADDDVTTWIELPDAPVDVARIGFASAWTGSELLVWGGSVRRSVDNGTWTVVPVADGARYTLERPLRPA